MAFHVAAPVLVAPAGPGPAVLQRACKPEDITATAQTRLIAGAVEGVVRLLGKQCSLHITDGPTALLDAAGTKLGIALQPRQNAGLVGDPRPDIPLAAGDALWGFSWTGSWCGPRAAAALVPLVDDANGSHVSYGSLTVPLSGAQLPCTGASHAILTQGYPGSDTTGDDFNTGAAPVLPAPTGWQPLHATLDLATNVSATQIPAYTLTFTNPTGATIALLPCPGFGLEVDAGNYSLADNADVVPCTGSMSVPGHGNLRLTLAPISYGGGIPTPFPTGSIVTVKVAIAGIPTAIATTHVN